MDKSVNSLRQKAAWAVAGAMLVCAVPAAADVKDGVDAWSRGDFAAAVSEWQGPADAGDADAMFNLAQAYRLGRGVQEDAAQAEFYYAEAAGLGHIPAADTYGLILFQSGRREAAIPYVQDAARRGDPRSRYLVGISHFNGDLLDRDWVKAYAMMTLASTAGLAQASAALGQMDEHIPLEQRQLAQSLAREMEAQARAIESQKVTELELALVEQANSQGGQNQSAQAQSAQAQSAQAQSAQAQSAQAQAEPGKAAVATQIAAQTAPQANAQTAPQATAQATGQTPAQIYNDTGPVPSASPRTPQTVQVAAVSPSVAAARSAISQAMEATGAENPADAGADFARSAGSALPVAPPPAPPAPVQVARAPSPQTPAPPAATPAGASGPWKIQLGAFSVRGNAERLWSSLASRSELAGKSRILLPSGGLTRLLAGGFSTREAANDACNRLKSAGQGCYVTQ